MGKYIYKISNDINDKIYIGQTNNVKRRFTEHCQKNENSIIHKAIVKYGKEHFKIEILGYFENYNEKEEYYIKFFNSIIPNGYNVLPGGNEPPHLIGEDNPLATITLKIAEKIQQDLLNYNLPRKEIKKKYKVSDNIIRHINEGSSWYNDKLHYPLRPKEELILEEKVKEVKRLLKETSLPQKEIAKQFYFSRSFVTMINIGQNHYDENEDYPLRKKPYNRATPVDEIYNMIVTTDMPLNKIAEYFQVNKDIVYNINYGRTYQKNDFIYPLRKH